MLSRLLGVRVSMWHMAQKAMAGALAFPSPSPSEVPLRPPETPCCGKAMDNFPSHPVRLLRALLWLGVFDLWLRLLDL